MAKATKRRAPGESMELMARAYQDAVRDILASDGTFHLAGRRRDDGGWTWDGLRWSRVSHAPARAATPEARRTQRDDVAAVG